MVADELVKAAIAMVTRRVIQGVLGNFLGTYMSRYTDFKGYWLFGFLIGDLEGIGIDLLASTFAETVTPLDKAAHWARAKFEDQMRKAGLIEAQVREAWLVLRRLPGSVGGSINNHLCEGYKMSFTVGAVMDNGRRYEREQSVFVAPHNAKFEMQSGRVA